MKIKNYLANIDILIADNDKNMRQVLTQNLKAMGMRNIHHVKNGEEALEFIRTHRVDLLITEWTMTPMDGIQLINYLRRDPNTPNRLIPIIMLTGKGEINDVQQARDEGITEFMVKPFTAKKLFARIESLVDTPRSFIVTADYAGPDRRRRSPNPQYSGLERRGQSIDGSFEERRQSVPRERAANQLSPGMANEPQIVAPSYELKRTIGFAGALSAIITPEMVETAQKVIEEYRDESLKWLKEDMDNLETALADAKSGNSTDARERMRDSALSIKSRAGMFGRHTASKIGRLLYLFLSSKYQGWKQVHNIIIDKHIDALKVAISLGDTHDGLAEEVLAELERVADQN